MPKISDFTPDTAPAAADLIPFVDVDAGTNDHVTVDNLAGAASFTGRYVPLETELWIWADRCGNPGFGGSPVLSWTQTVPRWVLDADVAEYVAFSFYIPTWVATYDAALVWSNAGGGAGDARLTYDQFNIGDAGSAVEGSLINVDTVTATALTSGLRVNTTMRSGTARPTSGLVRGYFARDATNVADTLANDINVYAVRLTLHP